MHKLGRYRERKALAEVNYATRLSEAKRMMGEARIIYEDDLKSALSEYQETEERTNPVNDKEVVR